MKKPIFILLIFLIFTTPSFADSFLMGDEIKGFNVKIAEDTNMTLRIRLQPRLDMGDLVTSEDGLSYESETDMYIRRIRLEFGGGLYKNLKYALVFEADKNGKFSSDAGKSPTNEVKIQIANIDYKFSNAIFIRFGKAKLPYSRVSLTSSSEQLLIERPISTEAAKKLFDDYYQSNLMFHGKTANGIAAYNFAIGDGWEPNSQIHKTPATNVHKSGPLYIARIELSPREWAEDKKSDAHLGKGKHLMLGINHAVQDDIEYKGNANEEDRILLGIDLSGHYGQFSAQFEYNEWKEKYSDPAKADKEPRGSYLQAGYFMEGHNIEPVLRYELYNQDSNKDDMKEKTAAIGANWYGKGHNFKLGLNLARTKYAKSAVGWLANDDTKDVFQVQAQLYF